MTKVLIKVHQDCERPKENNFLDWYVSQVDEVKKEKEKPKKILR